MKIFAIFCMVLKRELLLAYRHYTEFFNPLLFFILIIVLFPLTVGIDQQRLAAIAPGVIWISVLLASSISVENLFQNDFDDGTLEQFVLSPCPLALIVMAKVMAHWLKASLPLILISGLSAPLLYLNKQATLALLQSLLLGTPVFCFIASISVALTLGLKNRGLLLFLLIIPLYIPVLIFGTSAVIDAATNLPVTSQLAFLAAIFVFTLTFAPIAIAASLRISIE